MRSHPGAECRQAQRHGARRAVRGRSRNGAGLCLRAIPCVAAPRAANAERPAGRIDAATIAAALADWAREEHSAVLLRFQADMLGVDVVRPTVTETTALGAAYAAGIAVGFWSGEQDVIDNWAEDKRWTPSMDEAERGRLMRNWKKAVTKTLDWVDDDVEQ